MIVETTPPFLAWALEQACPLRNIDRWTEPERTERHLRAIVEYAAGLHEGRVIDGVCLGRECVDERVPREEWTGFAVEEAMAMFGGREFVEPQCGSCPANVLRESQATALGSCHGLLPLPQFEQWTEGARRDWFQRCAASPWRADRAHEFQMFSLLVGQGYAAETNAELTRFLSALQVCSAGNLPLHVRMFPAGRVEGRRWILPQTCETCGGPWDDAECCRWCQARTPSGGEVKRHVRGRRPYLPLKRMLSAAAAEEHVAKLRAARNERVHATRERYQQMTKKTEGPACG